MIIKAIILPFSRLNTHAVNVVVIINTDNVNYNKCGKYIEHAKYNKLQVNKRNWGVNTKMELGYERMKD